MPVGSWPRLALILPDLSSQGRRVDSYGLLDLVRLCTPWVHLTHSGSGLRSIFGARIGTKFRMGRQFRHKSGLERTKCRRGVQRGHTRSSGRGPHALVSSAGGRVGLQKHRIRILIGPGRARKSTTSAAHLTAVPVVTASAHGGCMSERSLTVIFLAAFPVRTTSGTAHSSMPVCCMHGRRSSPVCLHRAVR